MVELTADDTVPAGAGHLRDAAADLRALLDDADPAMSQHLGETADALRQLADDGASSGAAVDAAAQALVKLGNEVHATCHFPVG